MAAETIRKHCMSYPHVTEEVLWGSDLVFKIGGKMFAVTCLEPAPVWVSLKASDEDFAEFTEREGIIPAPYMARHKWIAVQHEDALTAAELKRLLRSAYDLVLEKLPKKKQAELAAAATSSSPGSKAGGKARGRKTGNN